MSGTLRIAICDPTEASREHIKTILLGMDNVWLEADCSRFDFFSDVVEQTTPDAAVINIDSDENRGLEMVEQLNRAFPSVGLIVISSSTDGQVILRAMRSGAREFVNSPIKIEDLVSALDRVADFGDTTGRRAKSGNIIAVAGASGGVGTTSVAVNLACALALNPERSVALVDLDLSLGDADVFLDSIPEYTLMDVAQNISRLDLSLLRKSLTKHDSGVYLLPRPVQLNDNQKIVADDFGRVLGLLKASFSHLVIDLSKSYTPLDLAAMQAAQHVVLLTQLDLPCLRNVVRLMMSLETFPGILEKTKIVVNRSGLDKSQISVKRAEETIGREIYWQIPNNFSLVSEGRNNGVPLVQQAPKAAITLSINELAESFTNSTTTQQSEVGGDKKDKKDKKAGWLSFLSK